MPKSPSPLVGYNTNVRHKGRLYHIQTEDSGVARPHIITHLFADGGRIVASRKTDYAQYLGSEQLASIVRKLMKEQHKAMFVALRDCAFDDEPEVERPANPQPEPVQDLEMLERAAEAHAAQWAVGDDAAAPAQTDAGLESARKAMPSGEQDAQRPAQPAPRDSIFGGVASDQKSLDEVILRYLSDDVADDDET